MAFTWKGNPTVITFTSPTDSDWETYDGGADTDFPAAGSGGAGFMINNSGSNITVGYRYKKASAPDVFTFTLLGGFMCGWFCGFNGDDEMEFFSSDWSNTSFYISGFFGDEAVFFENAKDKSQTTTGSYVTDISLTTETSASATHVIFLAYPTTDSTNTFGIRSADASTAIEDNVGRGTGGMMNMNASQEVDQFISDDVMDFKIYGYTTKDITSPAANSTDISVTDGNWTTRTINAAATGVVLETEKAGGGGQSLSFRTDDGDTEISADVSKTWLPVKCNPSGEIDILGESANVNTWWNFYTTAAVAGGNNVPPKRLYYNRRRAS